MSASQTPVSTFQWVFLAGWVLLLIAMCVKGAVDPKFAARWRAHIEGASQKNAPSSLRQLSHRILWVVGALAAVMVSSIIKRLAAVWHLSDRQEMTAIFVSVAAIIGLGFWANRALNRYWQVRAPVVKLD